MNKSKVRFKNIYLRNFIIEYSNYTFLFSDTKGNYTNTFTTVAKLTTHLTTLNNYIL